ncbi:acyltransferase domain-containing protein, partial [Streptomyces sp. NPDC102270]|uniref:acyltransferase domain-containing protein n=1 Tax=Streptomyces sp. NPDC102270 TaxID=3366150 RepID=UPI00382D160F
GIIKMIHAMHHGLLPPTLHADTPSPLIDWDTGAVRLLTDPQPWPESGRPRRAAVSSFGISGTNAHVILEQAPATNEEPAAEPEAALPVTVLPLSARTPDALAAQAQRIAARLGGATGRDLGFSLATTRARLDVRAVVAATDEDGLRRGLEALASGGSAPSLVRGAPGETGNGGAPAFLFTGQGSQRPGMGRELYAAYPVFAETLDTVCSAFGRHLDRPLLDVIFAPEGSAEAGLLDETLYTQTALFALEVALYRLAESWGLGPGHVMGHSIGEVAAAHVAGVFSLADACTLVAARGRLMQALPPGGAMLSALVSEDELAPLLAGRAHEVSVAAVNGPASTVISGTEAAVTEVDDELAARGVKTRRLRVSHAFHSPLMEPMLADFRAVVTGLSLMEPRIPVVSNLYGRPATAEELCSPEYWVRHVREAVRFHDGVTALVEAGVTTFVELGPDAVLTALAQESLADRPEAATLVPTLRRGRPQTETFTAAVATAYVRGADVDWGALYAGSAARQVALPTYPFQRRRYWMEADGAPAAPAAGSVEARFWTAVEQEDLRSLATTLGTEEEALGDVLPVLTAWRRRHAVPLAAEAEAPAGPASVENLSAALGALPPADRERRVLDLVRTEIAEVLQYTGKEAVEPRRQLKELGFDSLAAVTLRNRLAATMGLPLPATLVFDHPTPVALATRLAQELTGPAPVVDVDGELDRIGAALAAADDAGVRERAAARLQELLSELDVPAVSGTAADDLADRLDDADGDDLFDLIDSELGSS